MHTAAHFSDAAASASGCNYRRCNRLSFRSPISHATRSSNRVALSSVSVADSPIKIKRMASLSASSSMQSNGGGAPGDFNRTFISPSSSYIRSCSYGRQGSNLHRSRAPSLAIIKALQQQQQHHQLLNDQHSPPVISSRKISAISQASINGVSGLMSPYDDQNSAMSDQLSINLSILLDGKIDWRIRLYRLQLRLLKYAFVFFNSIFIAVSVYLLFISNNSNTNLWIPANSLIILALMFGIILSGIAISGALKEQLYLVMTYSIIFTLLLIICYAYYYKTLTTSTVVKVFSLYLLLCYYYCYILHLKPSPTILPDGTLIKPKEQMLLNSIKRKSMRRQSSLTSALSGKKFSNSASASAGTIGPTGATGQSSTMNKVSSDQEISFTVPNVPVSKSSASESDLPRESGEVTSVGVNLNAHPSWASTSREKQHLDHRPEGDRSKGEEKNLNIQSTPSSLPIIQFSSFNSIV